MARFCQIKIWDKLTLIKRTHLQHCLPTVKKQLAASLSPYCLHPSLSNPPTGFCWVATAARGWTTWRPFCRQVGTISSIPSTFIKDAQRNWILETDFYFLEEKKKTVNILKGCQLQSGLFQDFKSKGSFWISLLMLYAAQGLRWAAESEAARVKGGSHFLPQNGSWFFVFFFLSHQRASK